VSNYHGGSLSNEAGLVIYGYVILENHLHLVATSARNYAGQEGLIEVMRVW
jgi:hypothetical protein